MTIPKLLTIIAMFLMGASILLPDTAPMSPRSIVTAAAVLLLATVSLLQALNITEPDVEKIMSELVGTWSITVDHKPKPAPQTSETAPALEG